MNRGHVLNLEFSLLCEMSKSLSQKNPSSPKDAKYETKEMGSGFDIRHNKELA